MFGVGPRLRAGVFEKNGDIENNHFKWDMLWSDITISLKNPLFSYLKAFNTVIFVGVQKTLLYLKLSKVI